MPARSAIFVALVSCVFLIEPIGASASSFDQLTDVTRRVSPTVTMKGCDTFTSDYWYDVSVRNLLPI